MSSEQGMPECMTRLSLLISSYELHELFPNGLASPR